MKILTSNIQPQIKDIPKKEGQSEITIPKDEIALYKRKKTEGWMNKVELLKKELLSTTKGRTYLLAMGGMGLGAGALASAYLGPLFAIPGGAIGMVAGIAAGTVMNTPIKWLKPGNSPSPPEVLSGSDVQLESAKGASTLLSAEVQKKVDEVTGSHISEGNSIKLLKNGSMSFPERYELIESAKKSINIQTFIFADDETGWKMAKLLAKKAKEGVKCRVLYDWLGSPKENKIYKYMEENGVEVIAYNTPLDLKWHKENTKEILAFMKEGWEQFKKHLGDKNLKEFMTWAKDRQIEKFHFWLDNNKKFFNRIKEYPPFLFHRLNNRWHQKIFTVDNKAAILGGMNIGSDYAYGGTDQLDFSTGAHSSSCKWMRDTDVTVKGPMVDEVIKTFADNCRQAGYEKCDDIINENPPAEKAGNTDTRFITHLPVENKDKNIENWYCEMLDNAKETAYITNPYFVPNRNLMKHLADAAKRGVDVRIITNSTETNDMDVVSQAGRADYRELIKAGVRIYELKPHESGILRSLHAKTAVFDGEASTIGSHNLDPRSLDYNSECTATVHDREFGQEMNQMFKEDCTDICQEITLSDLEYETPADRLEHWFYGKLLHGLL